MSLNVYVLTYNRPEFLMETIDSILNQTYKDFCLYILDNCSTDNTPEIVSKISDKRVHYIRHKKNLGGCGNINYAISHCESDSFVIFHDDDIMLPCFLERELAALESNPAIVAVGGNTEKFGIVSIPKLFDIDRDLYFENGEYIRRYLRTGDTLVFPSVMYRTTFMKKHHIKMETAPGPCGDIVLLADIERHGGGLCQLSDVIMKYRVHNGQDTSRNYYSMHIKLFDFLKNDEYYRQFYYAEKDYYIQKYNMFCRSLFFGWFYKQISDDDTEEIYKQLSETMLVNKTGWWAILFRCCEKCAPMKWLLCGVSKAKRALHRTKRNHV